MSSHTPLIELNKPIERAILVGVDIFSTPRLLSTDESLSELALLSATAGIEVLGVEKQKLETPNPATFIGKGKVEEIRFLAENLKADLVIFDEELSPRHFKEMEKDLGGRIRVLDRSTLILDIFAQHAQTREGKLQVELAQYEYLLPRLTRAWTHLARQAGGGGGRAGSVGGVGLRGPGETQLEVDKRLIRKRISVLKDEIEKIREHRNRYRQNRKRTMIPIVALVGYTNAGKSTLLNALTNAGVLVADKLFATLDPTTRRLELPGGHAVLVTDTVGFIQKLPTHLIAAFRATLEEIAEADLLLHVVDISHRNALQQWKTVNSTLSDIQSDQIPMLTVLNKSDQLTDFEIIKKIPEFANALMISAKNQQHINDVLEIIKKEMFDNFKKISVVIPYKYGNLISVFHQMGKVEKVEHRQGEVALTGSIPLRLIAEFERFRSRNRK